MGKINTAVPVIPISYGSTNVIETGDWSSFKPQSLTMVAPCQEACPIGTDIPLFLHFIEQGRYAEALTTVLKENPFPGVCGRVCFHPCETGCNRAHYDEAVSIQLLERFVSSLDSNEIPIVPALNEAPRKIAVIGAGPAGLSCAYFLALLGHLPTVFEAKSEAGGVMRWGIPRFRLPRAVLKKEIRRILALSVKLRTNCRAGKDLTFEELDAFDAVFLSPGAGINSLLAIEGENLPNVWNGGEFLARINAREEVRLGKSTIVIGGGNTAMDVARTAVRLGSRVTVAYRRTRNAMPAIPDEVLEAEEEGIEFQFLLQPAKIKRVHGRKLKVTFQCMKPGTPDKSNRPRVLPVKGKWLTLEADSVIGAVGEIVDFSWIPEDFVKDGLVEPGGDRRIFAGGDAVAQPRTVADAIAAAKRAAISMDLFFQGKDGREALARFRTGHKGSVSMSAYLRFREEGKWPETKEVVSSERINTLYFEKSRRVTAGKLQRDKRRKTYREVNLAPDAAKALISASRCYSCGQCNACYNCFYFCPEGAIAINRDERTRTVDLAHCKGCGTCAKACPRNAVMMKELS
jgi:NADPH-dependent glutamate synthase beta subunit-like oxidoreductase/Pyruvate/2-oxoacid:ferredoxin oxidoreductase delta subunit